MLRGNINHFNRAFLSRHDEEHRRGGRFRTSSVHTALGHVLDLSHCGALVLKKRFRKAPALATFPLEIKYEELSVTVTARVARQSKQAGIGQLLGLEFIDVTEQQRDGIKDIIRDSRSWEVLPGGNDRAHADDAAA